ESLRLSANASLGALCVFVSPLAPFGKERLNYRRAFGCEHAESDFHLVVEPGVGQDLEASAYRPALWVIRAVDQPRNARLNHCARAHTARLNGYIESRLCKPVIAENPCGFAQNNDFGVRRRVAIPDGAVPRARDDSAFVHQHRSDRHFSGVSRSAGLVEGLLHVGIVSLCHRRENNTRRSKKDLALNYFPKSRIAVSLAAFFFAKKNAYPSILGSAWKPIEQREKHVVAPRRTVMMDQMMFAHRVQPR